MLLDSEKGMGTLEDITNSVNSFNYLNEVIIILAVILVGLVAFIIYKIYTGKKKPQRREEPYYSPQYQPEAQPEAPEEALEEASEEAWEGAPKEEKPRIEAAEVPLQKPEPQPANPYPGSIVVVGNYTLFDDRIQISPRKCVYYDEITSIRYESNYTNRVVVTIGHAWELSLSADDQTLKLYNGIMTRMNSELIVQSMNRKRRLLSR